MPNPLPAPVSSRPEPPSGRSPEPKGRPGKAVTDAAESSFDEVLGSQQEPRVPSTERAATPHDADAEPATAQRETGPGATERGGANVPPDAQPTPRVAQVLPTVEPAAGGRPATDPTPLPGDPAVSVEPATNASPGSTIRVQTPPAVASEATNAARAESAPAPEQVQPVIGRTGDRPAPRSEARRTTARARGGPDPVRHPIASRTLQVESAVRLENASGQPATTELNAATPGVVTSVRPVVATQLFTAAEHAQSNAPEPEVEPKQFTARVLRGLNAVVNQRGGAMMMRLQPPELGDLRVQMTVARGVVNVQFMPTTAQAQALLERSISTLRAGLESHGLAVERVSVQTPQTSGGNTTREQGGDEQTQQNRSHQDAGQGESRGRRDGPARFAGRFTRTTEPFAVPADVTGSSEEPDRS